MNEMRGMTPEEAAAYKRLKSRIFTRVSRGKEGVMDGIESFHCPLCKCKTTVDFTSHLVERAATIAALTAMLEKSVTLDVWRMTVQEFEKKIASLTAERDALETATRKVVDAGKMLVNSVLDASGHMQDALADPTIVALRRE